MIGERHVKMWVEVPRSGRAFDAIAFNHVADERGAFVPPEGLRQLVYRLDVNEYQGERRLQLLVDHLLPADPSLKPARRVLASAALWKSISSRRQLKDLAERMQSLRGFL